MTPPNMAAITASLERSLQNFSLNHHHTTTGEESTNTHCHRSTISDDATLELNSNIILPYHWEQCLDLKTGEMYYINWRTGMKSKEDPRTIDNGFSGYFYSDEEDEDKEEDEEESSYADSESSSVESSPAASSSRKPKQNDDVEEAESGIIGGGHVLVVAGCKGCFMYFMVPKQVEDCPKCCGQLLHFDRFDDN
ncbi:protein CURLY FLAG LEAF 1-like [Bidens hawaiensis]|uniref:protein CURLY FLAG LEAF 1-like n=1 Tax=Bidens hawaiensis TaxID=980011 RepID=UPI0040497869